VNPQSYRLPLVAVCALLVVAGSAQVPSKCLEIERILVDACVSLTDCPFSSEAMNEMAGFRVGPGPIQVADIDVTWPNNTFLGFVQNATTASLVATLNSGIAGCGLLVEPDAGVLPAGARVLLITSTQMCPSANSFAALADTLHVLFQNPGNASGHFVNHNNGVDTVAAPIGASSLRTLIITHIATQCSDSATYDRSLLLNIYGNYGGSSVENDGATAEFSWPGVPQATYVNLGCQAPFIPTQVEILPVGAAPCAGIPLDLVATVSGAMSYYWQGGAGTFSDPTAPSTTYTPAPGDEQGTIIQFCAVDPCGTPVCADLVLGAWEVAEVSISAPALSICPGDELDLTAVGSGSFVWSTGEVGAMITIDAPGSFSVTATTACGEAQAYITIAPAGTAIVEIEGGTAICAGGTLTLTATGATSYLWSTGSTGASIVIDQPGTYSVTGTSGCGEASATVDVVLQEPPVAAIDGPSELCGSSIVLTASGGGEYLWNTGATSASIMVTSAGVYSVTVSNACGSDQADQEVYSGVLAAFDVLPGSGDAPLTVQFLNLSMPDDVPFSWSFGDGSGSTLVSPQHVFTAPGVYTVVLVAGTSTCADAAVMVITVTDPNPPPPPPVEVEPSSVSVPNVFTPNGDGVNDVLELDAVGLESVEMGIFNRWGQLVYRIQWPREVWDARTIAGEAVPDGTYFYDLRATGFDGVRHELRGTVTVLR
jgi:gliding motility-associated-like protein